MVEDCCTVEVNFWMVLGGLAENIKKSEVEINDPGTTGSATESGTSYELKVHRQYF